VLCAHALVIAVIVIINVWDVVAAITEGETVTGTFRCSVAQTNWRWPVLVLAVLLFSQRDWLNMPQGRLFGELPGPDNTLRPTSGESLRLRGRLRVWLGALECAVFGGVQ
jgi:hypothetical protein